MNARATPAAQPHHAPVTPRHRCSASPPSRSGNVLSWNQITSRHDRSDRITERGGPLSRATRRITGPLSTIGPHAGAPNGTTVAI